MVSRLIAKVLVLASLASLSLAQSQTVTAHFDVVHEGGGKGKAKDSSNVVVWLAPLAPGIRPVNIAPSRPPRLVQKNKAFSPHILVVPVGSVVEFPNRDPFFHNVFSLFEGKRFDLGLYEAGGSRMLHFDRAGVSYLFCNIHPEMSAVILVVDTPYFGTSNSAGDVSIADVAPGQYTMHVWYEGSSAEQLQALTRQVTISASLHTLGNLRVADTPGLRLSHNNKYGQPYETATPSSPVYVQR